MAKTYKMLMFMVFLLLGMLIALQFRGIINKQDGMSVKEMASMLEAEEAEGEELLERLNDLEAEWSQLVSNIGNRQQDTEVMELIKQRDYEFFRAGLTSVRGDGVVITMQDAQSADGTNDIKDYIVHDGDINDILNELRINGAQAISINGERILGTSKLVCAGPTIFLNRNRYPPPYVIKAIGDPDVLYDAVDQLPNVAIMRLYGIRVDIRKEYDMIIEKYQLYESADEWLSTLEVVTE